MALDWNMNNFNLDEVDNLIDDALRGIENEDLWETEMENIAVELVDIDVLDLCMALLEHKKGLEHWKRAPLRPKILRTGRPGRPEKIYKLVTSTGECDTASGKLWRKILREQKRRKSQSQPKCSRVRAAEPKSSAARRKRNGRIAKRKRKNCRRGRGQRKAF